MSRKTYSFGKPLPPRIPFNRANYEKQCEGIREAMAAQRLEFGGEESLTDAELPRLVPADVELEVKLTPTGVDLLARWRKEGAR